MRSLATRERVQEFMRELADSATTPTRIYFTGGASAVLMGWRQSTVDLDIRLVPDSDAVLRAIPRLKESLQINIELACPADFIPELPGWEERCIFEEQHGKMSFFHYDPYAQALSKIERGHVQDVADVAEMVKRGLVDPSELLRLFEAIKPQLYRYPALDPATFERAVMATAGDDKSLQQ